MSISCKAGSRQATSADAVVVFFFEDSTLFSTATRKLSSEISDLAAIIKSGDFTGKANQTAIGYTNATKNSASRFILTGLGKKADFSEEKLRRAAAAATKKAASINCKHIAFDLSSADSLPVSVTAQAIGEGSQLSQYGFVKYKTGDNNKFVTKFTIICSQATLKEAQKGASVANALYDGVTVARNLANAPNCEIYPETLAKEATVLGKKYGFKVTTFNKQKIAQLKMGGLLGVNQGSVRPPAFITLEYMKGPKSQKPIVLVGKGVTFDTGGISIKPAAGMSDMKSDMHGAASVIGTMVSLAALGVKRNVVGLIPSTENMPSGSALVPGDIVRFMNGKTAEIDNTDAEGRLILADALCYADKFNPEAVIDLATLTGAIVIALGNTTTGMMGTDESTMKKLQNAGDKTGEYVCRLPLYEEYEELISSDYADVKNSGGRAAGSITAALFLKTFVSYPWVHLDIAGTGINPKAFHYTPKGGTGVGVRLLTEAISNW